jgi:3-oxoacyl-[acyl-carrier protein] reductase
VQEAQGLSFLTSHYLLSFGSYSDKMLHNLDDATFRQMLECHTVAPFRIIRAAAPYLRIKEESKRENRSIINVSFPGLKSCRTTDGFH